MDRQLNSLFLESVLVSLGGRRDSIVRLLGRRGLWFVNHCNEHGAIQA
jgi:hypothetical protein